MTGVTLLAPRPIKIETGRAELKGSLVTRRSVASIPAGSWRCFDVLSVECLPRPRASSTDAHTANFADGSVCYAMGHSVSWEGQTVVAGRRVADKSLGGEARG